MRVVGGRLKGRNLASPSSREIRPTADRLRESLRLEPSVFRVEELGKPIAAGHEIGPKQTYFPAVAG